MSRSMPPGSMPPLQRAADGPEWCPECRVRSGHREACTRRPYGDPWAPEPEEYDEDAELADAVWLQGAREEAELLEREDDGEDLDLPGLVVDPDAVRAWRAAPRLDPPPAAW